MPLPPARDATADRAVPATAEKAGPTLPSTSPAPARAAAQENAAPSAFAQTQKSTTAPALRRERAAGVGSTNTLESESSSSPAAGPARPVASLLAAIDQGPRRWRRAGAADTDTGLDPATRQWLESVETATAGRWREATGQVDALPSTSTDDDSTLLLEHDGRIAAALRLEAGGLRLITPTDSRFAILSGETLDRLRRSLPPAH
jgi:hypothetical protein